MVGMKSGCRDMPIDASTVTRGPSRRRGGWTRRRFLRLLGGGSVVAAGLATYACGWEPHWLQVVRCALPVEGLPRELDGASLVQLSDLHLGPRVSDDYLFHVFDVVRGLRPDIVVHTGDFTSYEPDIYEHARRVLARLPLGRLGTAGILGNHDYGPNWAHPEVAEKLAALATNAGMRVLRNEVMEIAGLQLVGLDDLWAGRFNPEQAMKSLDPVGPALALSHNPDTVDRDEWGSFRGWILAGHTHGGQCKPPFLPPPLLPVRNRRYTAGVFELTAGRRMYVSRGVGHLLRARFNVRPEVTVFRLCRP